MKIVACDPGLSGAYCVLEKGDGAIALIFVIDLPVCGEGSKRRLDAPSFNCWLANYSPAFAYIENGRAMPKQGVAGVFRYARICGAVEGVVAARHIFLLMFEPTVWKRYFHLGLSKEDARGKAIQLLPSAASELRRRRDHNRAEALLLGIYALEKGFAV